MDSSITEIITKSQMSKTKIVKIIVGVILGIVILGGVAALVFLVVTATNSSSNAIASKSGGGGEQNPTQGNPETPKEEGETKEGENEVDAGVDEGGVEQNVVQFNKSYILSTGDAEVTFPTVSGGSLNANSLDGSVIQLVSKDDAEGNVRLSNIFYLYCPEKNKYAYKLNGYLVAHGTLHTPLSFRDFEKTDSTELMIEGGEYYWYSEDTSSNSMGLLGGGIIGPGATSKPTWKLTPV